MACGADLLDVTPSLCAAAIIEPQPLSILLQQPYDIRLAIYSHVALCPFEDYRTFAGLGAACRQLREEIKHESARQLKAYLDKVAKSVVSSYHASGLLEGVRIEDAVRFSAVYSGLKIRELRVTIPFLPPHPADDWQHFCYSPRRNGILGRAIGVVQPQLKQQHRAQEDRYRSGVETALEACKQLHSIDFTCITYELLIHGEYHLQRCKNALMTPTDGSTEVHAKFESQWSNGQPIGRLVNVWVSAIEDRLWKVLEICLETASFHMTTSTQIEWKFSPLLLPHSLLSSQEYKCPERSWILGRYTRIGFAENRASGLATIEVNLEYALRSYLARSKRSTGILGGSSRCLDNSSNACIVYQENLVRTDNILRTMEALSIAGYNSEYEELQNRLADRTTDCLLGS